MLAQAVNRTIDKMHARELLRGGNSLSTLWCFPLCEARTHQPECFHLHCRHLCLHVSNPLCGSCIAKRIVNRRRFLAHMDGAPDRPPQKYHSDSQLSGRKYSDLTIAVLTEKDAIFP